MRCPVDGAGLVISERSNIEIDYCPQCRGVWLDYGELEKILDGNRRSYDRSHDSHDKHQSYDYEERRRDTESSGRKRERGGFLEDVFGSFGD